MIAQYAKVTNRSVYLLIEKHLSDIEEFGRVSFQMTPFETKGGIQEHKIYHLNEEQATLLITYLKNTEPVRRFKIGLVRQFYAMRQELIRRQVLRIKMKPIRRELTDTIKDMPDHPHKGWDYKLYTDLAYKYVTGKNAAQLRKERGASKTAKAVDYLASCELEAVTKVQYQISVLIEMGMSYEQIKMALYNAHVKRIAG